MNHADNLFFRAVGEDEIKKVGDNCKKECQGVGFSTLGKCMNKCVSEGISELQEEDKIKQQQQQNASNPVVGKKNSNIIVWVSIGVVVVGALGVLAYKKYGK